jgi:outer membrane protein assembly factor BamB
MTGHREPAILAIPLDSQGDITGTEKIAWQKGEGGPYVPSPVLYGDRLYFTKGRNQILSCVDPRTGKAYIDQERIPGISDVYASPVAADGRIYFTGRDGTTVVIRHADELDVVATNTVGEPVDASPAIAGDEMFIRGEKHLFCIAKK